MLLLIVLSVLLLAVAIFALENAQGVTVRFLYWEIQSSVAVVTLAATAVGVLIAGVVGLASRLWRWKRGRASAGPSSAAGMDDAHGSRSAATGSTRSVGHPEWTEVR